MSATGKKLLTVFGATGNQGRSVINSVLASPTLSEVWSLRGITRDSSKPSSTALIERGVDMVSADMNNKDSLAAAIKGSHAVFSVTNYWESMSAPTEVQQGKNVADASIEEGVKLFIWSTLPHVTNMTGGKLSNMAHFDSKADVASYLDKVKKGTGMAVVNVEPGFYMANIKGMINPSPEDGVPTLAIPWNATATQVPLFDAAEDTGAFVGAVLAVSPEAVDGQRVLEVSEWITPEEMIKTLNKTAGVQTRFAEVPEDVFEGFLPSHMAKELAENMVLVRDYSYYGNKGKEAEVIPANEKLVGKVATTSWEQFVKDNGPWKW